MFLSQHILYRVQGSTLSTLWFLKQILQSPLLVLCRSQLICCSSLDTFWITLNQSADPWQCPLVRALTIATHTTGRYMRPLELGAGASGGKSLKPKAAQPFTARSSKRPSHRKPTHLPGSQKFPSLAEDRPRGKGTVTRLTVAASVKTHLIQNTFFPKDQGHTSARREAKVPSVKTIALHASDV